LTAPTIECKNSSASEAPNPGDIMSEHRATSSRNARATSSESAYAGGADDDGNIYLGMNGNKGVERYAIR
jgi:hypothetical protein